MGINASNPFMCVCVCAMGKGKFSVRTQRGIPGNPADMGIPPRQGRHMVLSGPDQE